MRLVIWTDQNGYKHRSLIRNSDPNDKAPEIGIPMDPPDLDKLNWEPVLKVAPDLDLDEFKRKLHNRLVQMSLITWKDVQRSQSGLTSAIMAVGRDRKILEALKRQLVMLYRQ